MTDRAPKFSAILMCLMALGVCRAAEAQSPPPDPTALVDALKLKPKTRGLNLYASAEQDRTEKRNKCIGLLRKKGTRGLSVEERSDLPEVVSDCRDVFVAQPVDCQNTRHTYPSTSRTESLLEPKCGCDDSTLIPQLHLLLHLRHLNFQGGSSEIVGELHA
jgi:hypothetical protein